MTDPTKLLAVVDEEKAKLDAMGTMDAGAVYAAVEEALTRIRKAVEELA